MVKDMAVTRSVLEQLDPNTTTMTPTPPSFPQELVGKKVLLASESLGPINGVSRTTQSLTDYLRANGVRVATCAPYYKGQHINAASEPKPEHKPIMNAEWIEAVEKKGAALGKRALGGAWMYHHEKDQRTEPPPGSSGSSSSRRTKRPPILARVTSSELYKRLQQSRLEAQQNPSFRLQGVPLPYNPDLTVAYPFRLGITYDHTFATSPDLIYLASPASVGFQFLLQLAQLPNPPPVLLNFQTDLASYAGILFWPPFDRYAKWLLQLVQGHLFRTPAVRTIFYPSAPVRTYMESAGAPAAKMLHLGRGVDTDLFHPARADPAYRALIAPNNEIIFVCVCRLAPEKGFEFLAAAAQRLALAGVNFKLLIVGGNTNGAVEHAVRAYFAPVSNRVIFTGMLRGDALSRAYATADVFLHCSVTETFGLVVLEAMASGVPVVAREAGGPAETVRHGESGLLVPMEDVEAFVEAAARLAGDGALRRRMAGRARRQAEETTWERINWRVAVELAAALRARGVVEGREVGAVEVGESGGKGKAYYGSWLAMARVYFAVGVVWVFWFIAVIPMLGLGYVHGLFIK